MISTMTKTSVNNFRPLSSFRNNVRPLASQNRYVGCKGVPLRNFSAISALFIDSNNGRDLDDVLDIANEFEGDLDGLNKYFQEKSESIARDYRTDSNSGAISGVDVAELDF